MLNNVSQLHCGELLDATLFLRFSIFHWRGWSQGYALAPVGKEIAASSHGNVSSPVVGLRAFQGHSWKKKAFCATWEECLASQTQQWWKYIVPRWNNMETVVFTLLVLEVIDAEERMWWFSNEVDCGKKPCIILVNQCCHAPCSWAEWVFRVVTPSCNSHQRCRGLFFHLQQQTANRFSLRLKVWLEWCLSSTCMASFSRC